MQLIHLAEAGDTSRTLYFQLHNTMEAIACAHPPWLGSFDSCGVQIRISGGPATIRKLQIFFHSVGFSQR